MREAGILYCNCCGKKDSGSDIAGKRKIFSILRRPGDIFPAKMEPGRRRISVNFAWNSGSHSFGFRRKPWKGRKYLNVRCMFTWYRWHDAASVPKINCVDDAI